MVSLPVPAKVQQVEFIGDTKAMLLRLFIFSATSELTQCGHRSGILTRLGQPILGTLTKIDREIPNRYNDFCNQNKS